MIPLALTSTDGWCCGSARSGGSCCTASPTSIAIGARHPLLPAGEVRRAAAAAFAAVIGAAAALSRGGALRRAAREAARRPRRASRRPPCGARRRSSGPASWSSRGSSTRRTTSRRSGCVPSDGGPLPFTHVAGQYLNLALTIDGKRVNRSYTIASSPTRDAYCEISVKRVRRRLRLAAPARDLARRPARQGVGAGRQVRLRRATTPSASC